jgi:hypothetical protein
MYLMWDAILGINLLASNNSLFRLTLEAGIFPEKKNQFKSSFRLCNLTISVTGKICLFQNLKTKSHNIF